MNSHDIEESLKQLFEKFSRETFIYDLLLAYGISKASITRLRKGDYNLSKLAGEVLYKKKVFFKEAQTDEALLGIIDIAAKEERILRHSPRFIIVTDYKTLLAKD